MQKSLKEIIESSTFKIIGDFIYAKVANVPSLRDCFFISKDNDEITAVFKEENLDKIDITEKNKDIWKLIELKVSAPFYSVGFLAKVTSTIVDKGMNVLVVSTYSKDYILVRSDLVEKAREVLINLGFKED